MKPRKIHTKSRNGCLECKRRHLKCDETRPTCRKCDFSKRECLYGASAPLAPPRTAAVEKAWSDTSTGTSSAIRGGVPLSGISPGDAQCSSLSTASTVQSPLLPTPHSGVDVHNIELFYHFATEICSSFAVQPPHVDMYRRAIVRRAFLDPFLMDQILALSACHMSILRPPRAAFYREVATLRQASALAGYKEIIGRVDASNCLGVLLFSHVLGCHVFWDIFNPLDEDFGIFLGRLVGCVRLLRAIHFVTLGWWDVLVQTDVGPVITQCHEDDAAPKLSHQECKGLMGMLDQADLRDASIITLRGAVNSLQAFFDLDNSLDTSSVSASTFQIFAWPITSSEAYCDLIDQRRPEAIVLLAYYAVLLHRRNKSWVIGDAGLRLMAHIRRYLGSSWDQWLEWPQTTICGPGELPPRAKPSPLSISTLMHGY